jgi:1-pyrroline-5-carboxylate dehydrogenase
LQEEFPVAVAEKITYTSTPEQIESMHKAFDAALEEVRDELGQTHPLIINGEDRQGAESFEVRSPADKDMLIGRFTAATEADVNDAVAAAKAAFPEWSGRPWQERVAILRRVAELIRERKFQLAAMLVYEAGKNRVEAIGEVEEAADMLDTYTAQMEEHNGFATRLDSLDPAERNSRCCGPSGCGRCWRPSTFRTR